METVTANKHTTFHWFCHLFLASLSLSSFLLSIVLHVKWIVIKYFHTNTNASKHQFSSYESKYRLVMPMHWKACTHTNSMRTGNKKSYLRNGISFPCDSVVFAFCRGVYRCMCVSVRLCVCVFWVIFHSDSLIQLAPYLVEKMKCIQSKGRWNE